MLLKLTFSLLLLCVATIESAKILGVFHFPSQSHTIMGSTLLKSLAKRGHQVTMLTSFPMQNPPKNYKDIELTGMLKYKEDNVIQQLADLQNASIFEKMSVMMGAVDKINEGFLQDAVVKDLLDSKQKFDLVILCWATNEAFLGLSHYLEASTVVFSTIGSSPITNAITANPAPFSYVPNMFPYLPDQMTLLQRIINTISYTLSELYYNFFIVPQQELVRQKYFPNSPLLKELLLNVSLVFLNSHFSIESPRPFVPNMIQIGGIHVEEPKQLTGELKQFMDSATNGVIYFSLGSNVKYEHLPKTALEAIMQSFSKLPLKVLWKIDKQTETDKEPKLPSNVEIRKRLPQRDILAHSNLKLFVTHGGLLSTTEAIYHAVPMVGIPVYGDQERIVDDGVNKGYVVKVAFNDLSEATLSSAINELLQNRSYKDTIRQYSFVLRDQPKKPLENAVFWVEYVLRHKGAKHLQTSALKLKWYQYYLLDVVTFLAVTIFVTLLGIYFVFRTLFRVVKKLVFKTEKKRPQLVSKSKKRS